MACYTSACVLALVARTWEYEQSLAWHTNTKHRFAGEPRDGFPREPFEVLTVPVVVVSIELWLRIVRGHVTAPDVVNRVQAGPIVPARRVRYSHIITSCRRMSPMPVDLRYTNHLVLS